MKHTASYNDEVRIIILENAPQNASYTSTQIQKEILSLYAKMSQANGHCFKICRQRSCIREMFFDVVHIENTKASTLKKKIFGVLSRNNLIIQNIREQWYDGASTMRGEWNGLQALFLNECPYVYYVHCFAHRLQLILVVTTQSIIYLSSIFSHLTVIANLVDSSSKRHDQLHIANAIRIAELTSTNKIETGKEKIKLGLSLLRLLDMFDHILLVLSDIINDKSSSSTKASADEAFDITASFEFVFIMHFMVELLKMTDDFFANTKELVQKFRENGWDQLFDKVKSFCEKHKIDMSYRFDENAIELLKLSSALDSRDGYKSLNINDICKLVEKFYPSDFTSQKKLHIKYQLELFELVIRRNIHFQNVSTLSELCQVLSKIVNTMNYYLVDILIKLILTLSISTVTTERAFSSMKFVKTRLRSRMEDNFLPNSLLMYIEKEITQTFSIDSTIDKFDVMKKCRPQFRMSRLNK
ncbi:hypothetical protein Pfo_000399 [Paulownia fortunei]|nr:hypothetical protein Pfo_000399 [Paulownia fortunei]